MKSLGITALALCSTCAHLAALDEADSKSIANDIKHVFGSGRHLANEFVFIDPIGDVFGIAELTPSAPTPTYAIRKYSGRSGRKLWEQSFPVSDSTQWFPRAAIATKTEVFLSAFVRQDESSQDWLVSKLSTDDGRQIWQRRINGPANGVDWPSAMTLASDGSPIVAGDSEGTEETFDLLTVKLSAKDGKQLWERRLNRSNCCGGESGSVITDHRGNVIVFGNSGVRETADLITAKYSADGEVEWVKEYDGGMNVTDFAKAVAALPDGSLFVLADTGKTFKSSVFYAKYSAGGEIVWKRQVPDAVASNSDSIAVKVDNEGNGLLLMSGISNGRSEVVVIRFDASSGEPMWIRKGISANGGQNKGVGMLLSRSGNPVILAEGFRALLAKESCLAELNISDGSTKWEQHYFGSRDQNFEPSGLAQDLSGDLVICGHLVNRLNWAKDRHFTLIKYNGETGEPVWGARWQSAGASKL